MIKFGIYKITNIVNNKVYIGSTIRSFSKRWGEHRRGLRDNKHHSTYLQNSWNKYGKDNFIFEIIEELHNKDEIYINSKEELWINYYNSCNSKFGYNNENIIDNKRNLSEATKEKIRKTKIGKIASQETRKKMSESHMRRFRENNEIPWNTGKTPSLETKIKMSNSQLGRKHSSETIEKIRNGNKGKKVSIESRLRISLSKKGSIPYNRKFDEETIKQIRIKRENSLSCIQLSKEYLVSLSTIKRICNNTYYKTNG